AFSWMTSWAISYAPSTSPNPALESAGQASGPTFSSLAAVHVPVPSKLRVAPAGPNASKWVIGDGTGRFVEPIVARPNTFVGTPSRSGGKPAWVIVTVSSAGAAAVTPSSSAQPASAVATIRALGISSISKTPLPLRFIDSAGSPTVPSGSVTLGEKE